jgi:hypothetical protein
MDLWPWLPGSAHLSRSSSTPDAPPAPEENAKRFRKRIATYVKCIRSELSINNSRSSVVIGLSIPIYKSAAILAHRFESVPQNDNFTQYEAGRCLCGTEETGTGTPQRRFEDPVKPAAHPGKAQKS